MSEDIEGWTIGSPVSILRVSIDVDGAGPRLHTHPYAETFVILAGRARFTLGDTERDGAAGDVLVAPPNVPHAFRVIGPETYRAVHVHASERFVTEWLA
jgi:quercetin dioxygenase-like cupin family protein